MAVPYSRTIIGNLPWYSVLIVTGILAALWLAGKEERRMGLPADTVVDVALIAVPFGIVGARMYYVLMSWEMFAANPISVLYIWQGGIGIYGGVLGGMLGVWVYARKKKVNFAFVFTGLGRGSVTNFDNRMVNLLSGGSPIGTNLLHSSFAVGAITAPMIFLVVSRLFGWRAALLVVVLFGCVSLINLGRMKLKQDKMDRKDKTNSTVVFLKNPSFLILALMMFCYLCSEYAINGWLVTYIQNKESLLAGFGKTGEELTAAVKAYSQSMATLLWVVMLAGRLFCAWLSTKVHQKKMMMVASFGVAIFYGLMLISSSIPMATICVAGLGFCMAGICPMIYSDAAIFTNTYPLATSFILGIGSSGAILMPTLVGTLAERFGFTGGMSAIFVTVLLLVVFATLNVTVKTRVPKEYKEQA